MMFSADYSFFCLLILAAALQDASQLPYIGTSVKETGTCECGKTKDEVATRIVGGEVAEPGNYPWMAAIYLNGKLHCGGSLINDRYILTAGHCLNRIDKNDLTVLLGVTHLEGITIDEKTSSDTKVAVVKTILHEDFASDYLHDMDDIGLIKLKDPVQFTEKIIPICLPKVLDKTYDWSEAVVTGWGKTQQDGSLSTLLRRANLKVMPNDRCRNITTIGEHITDSMLCAYASEKDACQGDSGGPLTTGKDGRIEQIGVVSWGIGCAKPGIPGVYTRLTHYNDWVLRNTADATYCKNEN